MPARFTACVVGFPEPRFEWFKDDRPLAPSERIQFDKEGNGLLRLTVNLSRLEDAGKYKLLVKNEHGSAWCEAELTFDGTRNNIPLCMFAFFIVILYAKVWKQPVQKYQKTTSRWFWSL